MSVEAPQPPPDDVDLTGCDLEPIHVPGSVQPHGAMLVADPGTLVVRQHAGDLARVLGPAAAEPVGAALPELLGETLVERLAGARPGAREPVYLGVLDGADGARLDATAHRSGPHLIVELEPAPPAARAAADLLAAARRMGSALQAAVGREHLWDIAAAEMRHLTGFDRVMIYRFLEDGSGAVVAEARRDDLPPLLNQHFPASDIPKQARALYLRNLIRVIPDVGYRARPLEPLDGGLAGEPVDMSDCALRSVSPVHIQYLRNMGVTASMSVSLVSRGRLWGMISCHHGSPRLVPYELRETCKHVGEIVSQQIAARDDLEQHRQRERLAALRDEAVTALRQAPSLDEALLAQGDSLLGLVPADGFAARIGDRIRCRGTTPGSAEVVALSDWLCRGEADVFSTGHLAGEHAPAAGYAQAASGLAAAVLSRGEPSVLMWFRAERVEVVEWAGNPHKPAVQGPEPELLSPRRSFEAWKETVRGRSQPWTAAETGAVERIRMALAELRQRERLRTLNLELRRTLEEKEELIAQKDMLMQEAHHRVQNSLQLVRSMLQLQGREAEDPAVQAHFDEAARRLVAVSMVHRRLWRAGHVEQVDLGAYLEELVGGLADSWGDEWKAHVHVTADRVMLPTREAVVLALVATELMTNAVKYAYDGRPGPVDVVVRDVDGMAFQMIVRDRGTGAGAAAPAGLGTRLTSALIAQLGGEVQRVGDALGTCVTLTLPRAGASA